MSLPLGVVRGRGVSKTGRRMTGSAVPVLDVWTQKSIEEGEGFGERCTQIPSGSKGGGFFVISALLNRCSPVNGLTGHHLLRLAWNGLNR